MTTKEFWPCSEGKNERHCPNCPIDELGLCQKFCAFVKSSLLPYTRNEIELKISQETFDAILRGIDQFKDIKHFKAYCWKIFKNQKASVFRSKTQMFERDRLVYEHAISPESIGGEPLEVLENYPQPQNAAILQVEEAVLNEQILTRLNQMIDEEQRCAEVLRRWYYFMKEGLTQKEMAQRMNMKQNSFNQELNRCKETISNYFYI